MLLRKNLRSQEQFNFANPLIDRSSGAFKNKNAKLTKNADVVLITANAVDRDGSGADDGGFAGK